MNDIIVGNLEIHEAGNGFYITYLPTGETRGMGDGVDMYWHEDGTPVWVGTLEFYEILQADLRTNYSAFLEAYFPEVTKEEYADLTRTLLQPQPSPTTKEIQYMEDDHG